MKRQRTYATIILHFLDGKIREHTLGDGLDHGWLYRFIASPWPYIYIIRDEDGRQFHESKRFVLRETEPIRHYYEETEKVND